MVVRRARDDVEARRVHRTQLIARQADVALFERLVIVLDRDDLVASDCVDGHALCAEPAEEIVLELCECRRIMPDDVDLRPDDFPVLDHCAPQRIGQHPRMVAREDVCARECDRLAVHVELLKRRLVDGERCDARVLRTREHLVRGQSLARGELQEPLIVDGELHRAALLLDGVALHTDDKRGNKSDEYGCEQHGMIVKFLHEPSFSAAKITVRPCPPSR